MFDIITFGSATRDIFLRAEQFPIGDFKRDHIKKEILLPFGLKVNIKKIHSYSGGGGTNTAATFAAQGLKSAYCGTIGRDSEGVEILKELSQKGINTDFVFATDKAPTNLSVIFSTPQERTILVYKGASKILSKRQIPWPRVKKSQWFYLASLSGNPTETFRSLIDFAQKNKIKVMANPGSSQLKLPLRILQPLFKKIDILLLNQEEGQILVKKPLLKGEKLIKEIKKFFPGILIMTNGFQKVFVSRQKTMFSAQPLKVKINDKTGAGDAFGAGFLSAYLKNKGEIEPAIQSAVANAAACIKKWGAKEGILSKGQKFKKVKVSVHESA